MGIPQNPLNRKRKPKNGKMVNPQTNFANNARVPSEAVETKPGGKGRKRRAEPQKFLNQKAARPRNREGHKRSAKSKQPEENLNEIGMPGPKGRFS